MFFCESRCVHAGSRDKYVSTGSCKAFVVLFVFCVLLVLLDLLVFVFLYFCFCTFVFVLLFLCCFELFILWV